MSDRPVLFPVCLGHDEKELATIQRRLRIGEARNLEQFHQSHGPLVLPYCERGDSQNRTKPDTCSLHADGLEIHPTRSQPEGEASELCAHYEAASSIRQLVRNSSL